MSLFDRIRKAMPPGVGDAGRSVDSGGLSAAVFGTSPVAQTPGAQVPHAITDAMASIGTTMAPGRLVQRISPVAANRGGPRKEYEGGGP